MSEVFHTKVVKIGELVETFKGEKMIILFQDNAPDELADYCVIHTGHRLVDTVKEGDTLVFAGTEYGIVYVGSQVQKNLGDLGHITLRFNNNCENEDMEGSVYVEDKGIAEIVPGDEIMIIRK